MTITDGRVDRTPVIRIAGRPASERRRQLMDRAESSDLSVVATGPTGLDGVEPLVLATVETETALLPTPSDEEMSELLAAVGAGMLPTDCTVIDAGEKRSVPVPETGPLGVGRRRVLWPCGWIDPTEPSDIEFVSETRSAGAVAELGIRGRGRGDAVADERVHEAWDRANATDGDPVVVINAHGSDQRPQGDRTLLASAPLTVVDGALAVADAVDATDLICYLSEGDRQLAGQLREAIESASGRLSLEPQVVTGPEEYRAGEPTTALEALEGADRLEPRIQPPPPSEYGLYGRPTVVHTPRTFAQIRQALLNPDQFDADAADPGTRLVTVTGDVESIATVELPTDWPIRRVLDAVTVDGQFKMACVGGQFGGLTEDLSVPCTASALRGSSLGTNGIVEIFSEQRCPVAIAGDRARFASEANSGRCVPGREGTVQLTELLRDVYRESYDPGKIRELGRVMQRSANCQIGSNAPRPVLTAIDQFESEFRAHADGYCPSGTCTESL